MDFSKFNCREYDFVAANLISQDLMTMGRKLVACTKPGKFLAVSGISLDNLKKVKDVFQTFPLRCVRVLKGKDWAAILYRRSQGM